MQSFDLVEVSRLGIWRQQSRFTVMQCHDIGFARGFECALRIVSGGPPAPHHTRARADGRLMHGPTGRRIGDGNSWPLPCATSGRMFRETLTWPHGQPSGRANRRSATLCKFINNRIKIPYKLDVHLDPTLINAGTRQERGRSVQSHAQCAICTYLLADAQASRGRGSAAARSRGSSAGGMP